jgi:rubredoxin
LGTEDSLKGLIKRMKKDKPKKQVSEKGSPGGGLSPSSTVPPASAAPEPGEAADSSDVHTEHCCRKCGCKYGDKKCTVVSGEKLASHPCENCDSGEDERTDLQGTKPQETDPRPPRSGKDKPVDYGKCPVCAGIRWKELKAGVVCAKCGAPHGEPVGDRAEDADPAGIKRAKAVKTCEALMREFDDLNLLVPKAGTHKQSIELCKTLLKSAKGWK